VIYFIEMNPIWEPKITAQLTALLASGDLLAISDLTRLECQVGPLMTGDTLLLQVHHVLSVARCAGTAVDGCRL
jgi:hypothetical protein